MHALICFSHWGKGKKLGPLFELFSFSFFLLSAVLNHLGLVWLCDPMNCSPPRSTVHGISQARILEWVAVPHPRGYSWPREPGVSCLLHWQADSLPRTTGEVQLYANMVAQMVKNQPAIQETQVQSLGQEDTLEKGMTTHCGILACRILWTEDPGGLHP